jgi:hypothetical protein
VDDNDNIIIIVMMGFKEIGYESVDWIHLYHDRDEERAVMNRPVL